MHKKGTDLKKMGIVIFLGSLFKCGADASMAADPVKSSWRVGGGADDKNGNTLATICIKWLGF